MTSKTHCAVGTAATLLILPPDNWKEFLICMGTASIGSCICDIDVSSSNSHKGLSRLLAAAAIASAIIFLLNFVFNIGIIDAIKNNSTVLQFLIGFALFLAICIFGERQPHRSFMHSVIAVAAISFSVYIMIPSAVGYVIVSMSSHIILDLLNRRDVQLFYPSRFGQFSLGLFPASGKADKVFFVIGCIGIVFGMANFCVNYFLN